MNDLAVHMQYTVMHETSIKIQYHVTPKKNIHCVREIFISEIRHEEEFSPKPRLMGNFLRKGGQFGVGRIQVQRTLLVRPTMTHRFPKEAYTSKRRPV